jgi:hypothetical protein
MTQFLFVSLVGFALWVGGFLIRYLAKTARTMTYIPSVKRLLDIRVDYMLCNEYKNEHYNRYLESGDQYDEAEARYFRVLQVYKKAQWSALFSGFRRTIQC